MANTTSGNINDYFSITGTKNNTNYQTLMKIYMKYQLLMVVIGFDTNREDELRADPLPYLTDGIKEDGSEITWGWWSLIGPVPPPGEGKGVGMTINQETATGAKIEVAVHFDPSGAANTAVIYLLKKGCLATYYDATQKKWVKDVKEKDEAVIFFIKESMTNMNVDMYGNRISMDDTNNNPVIVFGEGGPHAKEGEDDPLLEEGIYPTFSAFVHTKPDGETRQAFQIDVGLKEQQEYDVVISLPLPSPNYDILGAVTFPNEAQPSIILSCT